MNAILPEHRWNNVYSSKAMEVLVDGVQQVFSYNWPSKLNEYYEIHGDLLPFLAWQLDALVYDVGGTETAKRNAINFAREINDLIGSEETYRTVLKVVNSSGFLRYTDTTDPDPTDPREISVELFITPPRDRIADQVFIEFLVNAVRKVFPYTIEVTAVHIVQPLRMYNYSAMVLRKINFQVIGF